MHLLRQCLKEAPTYTPARQHLATLLFQQLGEPVADALLSMVPALLAYVGITGASATAPKYTPDQARQILCAVAK